MFCIGTTLGIHGLQYSFSNELQLKACFSSAAITEILCIKSIYIPLGKVINPSFGRFSQAVEVCPGRSALLSTELFWSAMTQNNLDK